MLLLQQHKSKTFGKMSRGTEEPEHPLRSPSSNQTERMWGQIISVTITQRGAQRERALVSTIQLPSSPSNKQTRTALCHLLRFLLFLLMPLRNRQLALNQPNIIPPSSPFPEWLAEGWQQRRTKALVEVFGTLIRLSSAASCCASEWQCLAQSASLALSIVLPNCTQWTSRRGWVADTKKMFAMLGAASHILNINVTHKKEGWKLA